MAENIFQKIQELRSAAAIPARGRAAQDWFRKTVRNLYGDRSLSGREQFLQAEDAKLISRASVARTGKLFMFVYDPKLKKKLPYYDRFPLIFVLEVRGGGLLGLNMHYLPVTLRLKLFNQLIVLLNNQNMDDETRLRLSYKVIKNASKYQSALSLIREYKAKYIRSKLLEVQPQDWEIVMFLPTETFRKSGKHTIWAATRKEIREGNKKRALAAQKKREKVRTDRQTRLDEIVEQERKKRRR